MPPNSWIKSRRHFNKVLRFSESIGALEFLAIAIEAVCNDRRLEVEIYPHEGFSIEMVRYKKMTDRAEGPVMAVDSTVLAFDSAAITITKNPWTPT